jgi:hypothetical protein
MKRIILTLLLALTTLCSFSQIKATEYTNKLDSLGYVNYADNDSISAYFAPDSTYFVIIEKKELNIATVTIVQYTKDCKFMNAVTCFPKFFRNTPKIFDKTDEGLDYVMYYDELVLMSDY